MKKATAKTAKRELLDKILSYHRSKIEEFNEVLIDEEDNLPFKYVVNTSGGVLSLMDFKALSINPESEKTFSLKPGERVNLLTRFNKKDINANRESLMIAFEMKGIMGLNALTIVEDAKQEFPFELVKETLFEKGLKEKEKVGQAKIALPTNEFDERLEKEIEKEERYNQNLIAKAGITTGEKRKSKAQLEQEEIDRF